VFARIIYNVEIREDIPVLSQEEKELTTHSGARTHSRRSKHVKRGKLATFDEHQDTSIHINTNIV